MFQWLSTENVRQIWESGVLYLNNNSPVRQEV